MSSGVVLRFPNRYLIFHRIAGPPACNSAAFRRRVDLVTLTALSACS